MNEENFPVIPADRGDDLHRLEDLEEADLVVFMAGNQFMAMPVLINAFRERHPRIRKIFYETLPPGLELRQILAGGAVFGDRRLPGTPDVYTSVSRTAMKTLETRGKIGHGGYRPYLRNRLTFLVPAGNPARIETVGDLGRAAVRISQPDPKNEDIAFHILDMYRQAGGEALVRRIMEEKRADGTTQMTVVHHRETPLRLAGGIVDVGPVWATEAAHARTAGLDFEAVEPGAPLDQRDRVRYYICPLREAPNPDNAQRFIDFVLSAKAQGIFSTFGFLPLGG